MPEEKQYITANRERRRNTRHVFTTDSWEFKDERVLRGPHGISNNQTKTLSYKIDSALIMTNLPIGY